jgi:hypothetical protein
MTSTMLKNQPDFGSIVQTAPYSSAHPGASSVPSLVQLRSILVKFFYKMFLGFIPQLNLGCKNMTSTMLKNQPDFGSIVQTAPYSSAHPGASFVPSLVQLRSILVKFFYNMFLGFILHLNLECKNVTSTMLKNQPDFGSIVQTAPYSSAHPGASSVPSLVQLRSILVKFFYNMFLGFILHLNLERQQINIYICRVVYIFFCLD